VLALLPSLQALQLTSQPATRGEWQDAQATEKDDWTSMDGAVQGFGALKHLYLDGIHPDQVVELVGIDGLLGSVETLSVRWSQSETLEAPEFGGGYGTAFEALARHCGNVRHLNLGVPSLDEALLRKLAQLELSTIDFMPLCSSLESGIEEAARRIWPQAEVTANGTYQAGIF
jgi:hypothetical protein